MKGSGLARDSLARRVIVALVIGEFIFAAVLSLTMGVFAFLSTTRQQAESLEDVSSIVAAGLMPIVADQRQEYVEAQLSSILDTTDVSSIEAIRIVDSSGATIATAGDRPGDSWEVTGGPLSTLPWGREVVSRTVTVDGLDTLTVFVRFAPLGAWELLESPVLSAALLLISLILISVPWTILRLTKELVQPLAELRDIMPGIVAGDTELATPNDAPAEIREFAEALRGMAQQLKEKDARLRASHEETRKAYHSLERAKRHTEELAAVTAHEIRTPLALIRLQAELLETGEITELDEAGLDAVAAIGSASSRLTTIVSDLMDAALLERGLVPIEFRDVWLDELLEDAARDGDTVARTQGMTVRLVNSGPEVVLCGDRTRLRQVLDNLMSNALKHSAQGSEITIRAEKDPAWAVIEIADSGEGLPADAAERLFTLFGRLDHGDSRETPGLGLGLAISKRVVEAHGGTIDFRANEEGRGSVFTVRLPIGGPPGEGASTMVEMVG